MLKSQINCKIIENTDCKKAYELVKFAEKYQGYAYSQIAFDKAIELCPDFDYAYREKSVPYLKRGDFITWKKLIDKAVTLNPKENLGYRGWCQYQFLRNYTASLKDIETLENLVGENNIGFSQNGNYSLCTVKALCYKGLGNNIKAIEIMEKQFSNKNYVPLLFDFYHLGVSYFKQKNYLKAKENFEKQIINKDYYSEPYYYLSLILLQENKKEEAKKMIDKAIYYYDSSKFMKDAYTTIIDKVYQEEIHILQRKLQN